MRRGGVGLDFALQKVRCQLSDVNVSCQLSDVNVRIFTNLFFATDTPMLLSLLCFIFSTASLTSAQISYQIHSYDDLRAFPSLLNRGASWFKFDLHFVSSYDCKELRPLYNCSGGVLLLSHNDPLLKPNLTYFTSESLIATLNDFSRPEIAVALCGKMPIWQGSNKPCVNGSDVGNQFLNVVDSLISSLDSVENCTFILDGSFKPSKEFPCFANRWTAYNSTWTGSPISAYISNEKTDVRFQYFDTPILDHPVETFLPFVLSNFGKFSLNSENPYFVWEPSDRKVLLETSKLYSKLSVSHKSGLRFAINISPERFAVFNAEYSNSHSWNWRLSNTQNLSSPVLFVETNAEMRLFAWDSSRRVVVTQSIH